MFREIFQIVHEAREGHLERMPRYGTFILRGPGQVVPQFKGCPEPPVRIPERGAGDEHTVSLSRGDGVLGLARRGQEAHSAGGYPCFPPDPCGEACLVAGARLDLLVRHRSPA